MGVYSERHRLYSVIDLFLMDGISAKEFCNEFHLVYDLEIDLDVLTDSENDAFSRLSEIVSRYSDYPSDFINCPNAFVGQDELKMAVHATSKRLPPIAALDGAAWFRGRH